MAFALIFRRPPDRLLYSRSPYPHSIACSTADRPISPDSFIREFAGRRMPFAPTRVTDNRRIHVGINMVVGDRSLWLLKLKFACLTNFDLCACISSVHDVPSQGKGNESLFLFVMALILT
jgi:hypothetical protein